MCVKGCEQFLQHCLHRNDVSPNLDNLHASKKNNRLYYTTTFKGKNHLYKLSVVTLLKSIRI